MKPYIFAERNNVYVIDLEKTVEKLKTAADFAREVAKHGGSILFVCTKRQGQQIMKKYAEEAEMPYIIERWIGGLFTNFTNVNRLLKKYKDLSEKKETGALEKYTKKEQVDFAREIEKLKKYVGGLGDMRKIPEAVFVVDLKKEKTAVTEARKKGVPLIGFCDTNINPELADYPIPANDDAVNSIEIIVKTIAEAIKEGRAAATEIKN